MVEHPLQALSVVSIKLVNGDEEEVNNNNNDDDDDKQ